MFSSFGLLSQQIVEAEYYFDDDPGFGLGTPISITADQEISDLIVSVDVSGISEGIHNLIVRAKDDTGSWSLTHKQIFLKAQLPSSSPIVELEYYFDIDPGKGNGNAISFTSAEDITNQAAMISTSSLSQGVHTLHIRSKGSNGIWSHNISRSVYVLPPPTLKNIVTLEYYVGNDPGIGNGTPIAVTAANDISNQSVSIPINDLDLGVNRLSIRGQNSDGEWSHSSIQSILKMKVPNLPDIVQMEYFFNNDPGYGNGTFVSYSADPDWLDLSVLINTSGLADGLHVLYIRSKNSNGIWSFSNSVVIQKTTIQELSDITMMEYFFDVDPGLGQGTSISITPDAEIDNQVVAISVAGLPKGVHTLFLRSKNTDGVWSLSQTKALLITPSKTTKEITDLEYFFDTDPGFGLGMTIDINSMPDIVDLNAMISVSGISNGIHNLFLRSRDTTGRWSQSYHKTILYRTPDVDEDIQKIEFYFGDDPGLGNGTDISMAGTTDIPNVIDFQQLLDISSLANGVHRLNIRSMDDSGVWTHTHTQPIYVYKNENGNMVKAEYFIDTDPGYGLATEITFPPELEKTNHIFPIDIDGLELGIYQLHVRYMSENNKWSQDEITPFYVKDGELYEMLEGEYFIDVDPGLGMATPFSFTAAVDVPDISVLIITTGIDAGEHDLYIRTKNEKGEWSLTNVEFEIQIESTLPLNILSFEVRKRGSEAILDWSVNNAINTSHFEIERMNRGDIEYLGRVESIDRIAEKGYQFIDTQPFDGLNYYRLKQVDQNEDFNYSPIRSVNFGKENNLVVYPNPMISEIRIDGNIDPDASYQIYDSTNRLVKEGEVQDNTSIDVSNLISGGYHFILLNGTVKKSFLIIKV